jgi:hypothetical protein
VHLEHAIARFERDRLAILPDVRLRFRRTHPLAVHADGACAGDVAAIPAAAATAATTSVATATAASTAVPLPTLLATAVLLTARLPSLTEAAPGAAVRP